VENCPEWFGSKRIIIMKNTLINFPFCCLALILLCSCSPIVIVEQPFAPTIPPVDKELLEGKWRIDDDFIAVQFTPDGIGHFASLDWSDGRFKVSSEGTFITTAHGTNRYLCALTPGLGYKGKDAYALLRYAPGASNSLTLWFPNPKIIAAYVTNGLLAGEVKYNTNMRGETIDLDPLVWLSGEPDTILTFLESQDDPSLFEPTEGIKIIKAVKEDASARNLPQVQDTDEKGPPESHP
jgi:hypothetical protein